jgi:hypothetical protein
MFKFVGIILFVHLNGPVSTISPLLQLRIHNHIS